MKVNGQSTRTIWVKNGDPSQIEIIDQRRLPHEFVTMTLTTVEDVRAAIADMAIRGAGLIGATAGFGMSIAAQTARPSFFEEDLQKAAKILIESRPTASNLAWAVNRQLLAISKASSVEEKVKVAIAEAQIIADEDAASCKSIGQHVLPYLKELSEKKNGKPLNILTHCNAGWLAFVDYGSATSPIYAAHEAGIPLHVWVDETRPRNQGASLTAWELGQQGVDHHLIVDNAGGHLMQHGEVDLVIVGTDRVTRGGDVANKIGTYLKALAAKDNNIPFYVALPSSTLDFEMLDGVKEIPIEERDQDEVRKIWGKTDAGDLLSVEICPSITPATNHGFDVTPARLVSALWTERGPCEANEAAITKLFSDLIN